MTARTGEWLYPERLTHVEDGEKNIINHHMISTEAIIAVRSNFLFKPLN